MLIYICQSAVEHDPYFESIVRFLSTAQKTIFKVYLLQEQQFLPVD